MNIGVLKKIIAGTTGYKVVKAKDYHGKFKDEKMNDNINASCIFSEYTIIYKEDRLRVEELLAHELGHAMLHSMDLLYYYFDGLTIAEKEFEAELFAGLVIQGLGGTYGGRSLVVEYTKTRRLEEHDYLQYYYDEIIKDAFYLKYLSTAHKRLEQSIRSINDFCKKNKIKFNLRETLRCLRHIMKYIENSKE